MTELTVNGMRHTVEAPGDTPLLWVLRDELGLKGAKFSCGAAMCGACTVHLDGEAVRSCIYPVEAADGAEIRTVEGLPDRETLHPVQQAWVEVGVPQCGYCQTGFIMSAVRLLEENPDPTDDDIAQSIPNICRCGTYERIARAVKLAGERMRG